MFDRGSFQRSNKDTAAETDLISGSYNNDSPIRFGKPREIGILKGGTQSLLIEEQATEKEVGSPNQTFFRTIK